MISMKAFVLCGGKGTRLRPYTYSVPKPMLKVRGKPILQHVVENLKLNGITDLVLTVGYKREQIMGYFKDGKPFGVRIEYAIENEPKNTAGSILEYKGKIHETFFVVMGDHITDINLKKMLESHKKARAFATLALAKHEIKLEYGVVETKGDEISGFREKPQLQFLVNTGIYAFEPEIFDFINEKEDFAKQVFPRLLSSGKKLHSYILSESWMDVGRVSDYERLNSKADSE